MVYNNRKSSLEMRIFFIEKISSFNILEEERKKRWKKIRFIEIKYYRFSKIIKILINKNDTHGYD